jgi:hypothetical protein
MKDGMVVFIGVDIVSNDEGSNGTERFMNSSGIQYAVVYYESG